ncbi:hypothetical protein CALVIDRAFT_559652 [Calocera viscosa TUFC12733]|uniref:F-box domain-containing protein n=1 Tax=Calocera viscosa (strain TUFC12733) TaxID=1330018 RepID=A0A167SFA5_CALVF|nr:hypothetical protein CALVIDRAFT_559652 [Calocera viscosa TUFC12733]
MHAVWRIAELAEMIMEHLPQDDVKRIMRCCRWHFALAVPIAWRSVDTATLDRLIEALPFRTNAANVSSLFGLHGRLLLTYFKATTRLSIYTRDVHNLKLSLAGEAAWTKHHEAVKILRPLLLAKDVVHLFPSMKFLEVEFHKIESVEVATLFIHPTLQRLRILGSMSMDSDYEEQDLLQCMAKFRTKLVQAEGLIEFSSEVYDVDHGIRDILLETMFNVSAKLASLQLSGFPLTQSTLSSLIALPNLRSLTLDVVEGNVLLPEAAKDLPYFSILSTFSCRVEESSSILALLSKMETLRKLDLELEYVGEEEFLDLHELALFIARSKATIRDVRIVVGGCNVSWTLSEFSPLLDCHDLQYMGLNIWCDLQHATDDSFRTMAQAWPDLRSFIFGTIPRLISRWTQSDNGGKAKATVSLDVLCFFAVYCPKLERIAFTGIDISPTFTSSLVVSPPNYSHSPLSLRLNRLVGIFVAKDVAQYVGSLYPGRVITLDGVDTFYNSLQEALDSQREAYLTQQETHAHSTAAKSITE